MSDSLSSSPEWFLSSSFLSSFIVFCLDTNGSVPCLVSGGVIVSQ
ncbi:BnaA01g23950D [Brassica napus]|uniref:(rape) hypothetical protein n=1 Tax=Brassica napus TaxID=3708 RepID=A0A078HCM1_BRANA|nr:unnamed protein product [Brassica napus]CDY35517.1 BnaA01g23950D [Brassica napus]